MSGLLASVRKNWSVGLFLTLLWLVLAVKVTVSLPVLLTVAGLVFLVGVWLGNVLSAFGRYGRSQSARLVQAAPTRREWFGIGLGVIAGLVLGTTVVSATNPEYLVQFAGVLMAVGAWVGRWLVRVPGRLSAPAAMRWGFRRRLWPLAGSKFTTGLTLLGMVIGLFGLFQYQNSVVPETAVSIGQLLTWTTGGGSLGFGFSWLLRRGQSQVVGLLRTLQAAARVVPLVGITTGGLLGGGWYVGTVNNNGLFIQGEALSGVVLTAALISWLVIIWLRRVPDTLRRRMLTWGVLGTAVATVYFAWFPLANLNLTQLLLAGTGTGTLISLIFIRPSAQIVFRSLAAGLLGLTVVGANIELTVARTNALVGIFLGMVASLIILNWLQTERLK